MSADQPAVSSWNPALGPCGVLQISDTRPQPINAAFPPYCDLPARPAFDGRRTYCLCCCVRVCSQWHPSLETRVCRVRSCTFLPQLAPSPRVPLADSALRVPCRVECLCLLCRAIDRQCMAWRGLRAAGGRAPTPHRRLRLTMHDPSPQAYCHQSNRSAPCYCTPPRHSCLLPPFPLLLLIETYWLCTCRAQPFHPRAGLSCLIEASAALAPTLFLLCVVVRDPRYTIHLPLMTFLPKSSLICLAHVGLHVFDWVAMATPAMLAWPPTPLCHLPQRLLVPMRR
jgi:hypothetical protein